MTNTLVVYSYRKIKHHAGRTPQAALDEAIGLARAIDLQIAHALLVPLSKTTPATHFGKGKVEEIKRIIEEMEISLVVLGVDVSPVQQRNLEEEWQCKVIDRTALILEIFGARARTAEGKLQVELAALNYQKTRLVRSWTHLERQRGGFGFMGGPGESQIEIDRRLIRDRIAKIKRELEDVVRTRNLHRKTRREVPYPIVALVGYTNAGKSTLFNRLTGADVYAADKLFATLDPTMRALTLPSGMKIILSDTVGFVSNLPHELVAAFRATLEEVLEAHVLLHIRDVACEDSNAQKADVEEVLKRLFEADSLPENVLEVCNKIDCVEDKTALSFPISALTGEGVEVLMSAIEKHLSGQLFEEHALWVAHDNGKFRAWLFRHGQVLAQQEKEDGTLFRVRLPKGHNHTLKE